MNPEESSLAIIPSDDPDQVFVLEVVDMPEDQGPMYFMALDNHPGFTHSILRAVVYSSREAADEQLEWTLQEDCVGYLPMVMRTSTTQLKVKELKLYTVDPDTQEIVMPGVTSGYVN
jgi:hypothetical protein